MKLQGGIDLMKNYFEKLSLKIGKQTKFHRVWSELSLSASILITNFAVANNTVAILICGDLFKEISEIEKIEPKRSASILDIYSCVAQGIIPYGAQILLASQIAKLSPLVVAGKVYYCYLLGLVVLINIFFQKNRPKTT
jgi:Na+/H+ antiporter NhaC